MMQNMYPDFPEAHVLGDMLMEEGELSINQKNIRERM